MKTISGLRAAEEWIGAKTHGRMETNEESAGFLVAQMVISQANDNKVTGGREMEKN